jgi:hypothetical protein
VRGAYEELEAAQVELAAVHVEEIAGRPRDERLGPERLAELRDEVLERGRRRSRRVLAPQVVDQAVGRDHLSRPQEQDRKQRALLLATQRQGFPAGEDLERTEDPELQHRVRVVTPLTNRA